MGNRRDDPSAGGHGSEPQIKLRAEDVAARAFQDETIVLDLRSSLYLSTNAAGSVLWQRLADGATRTELIDALLERFEVDRERAAQDVDAFVERCRERDLLAE